MSPAAAGGAAVCDAGAGAQTTQACTLGRRRLPWGVLGTTRALPRRAAGLGCGTPLRMGGRWRKQPDCGEQARQGLRRCQQTTLRATPWHAQRPPPARHAPTPCTTRSSSVAAALVALASGLASPRVASCCRAFARSLQGRGRGRGEGQSRGDEDRCRARRVIGSWLPMRRALALGRHWGREGCGTLFADRPAEQADSSRCAAHQPSSPWRLSAGSRR